MTRPAADVVLSGRYRLIEPLARGGMGTVWVAEDVVLGRRVAVKVLNEGLADDPTFIERFRREARAAAGLSHPNIAGVFDYGEDGSRPFIVMELVDGETLGDRLSTHGPLSPQEAARVGAEVAEALAEAHRAGVVHRDVKPANVMLTPRGVKVMDFGIASSGGASGLTQVGMVMGTARYLSPEQARGERATPASDVYALGVVLYEALTGVAPFERETPVATAAAHVHEPARPLGEVRPDVPATLAAVIDRSLAKDAAERPGPADDLARALREATGEAPGGGNGNGAGSGASTTVLRREPTDVLPAHRLTPRRRLTLAWLIPVVLALIGIAVYLLATRLSGEPDVRIPDFSGLGRAQAQAQADRLGIDVTFREMSSDERTGRVFDQAPAPRTLYASGSVVVLILSTGPELVTVPSVLDAANEDELIALLGAAGLEFGEFLPVRGETGIVGTQPPEGSEVPPGTTVDVLLGTDEDRGKGKGKDKDDDD